MRMIMALTLGSCAALTKGDTGSIHPTGGSANSLASPPPLDSLHTASVQPPIYSFVPSFCGCSTPLQALVSIGMASSGQAFFFLKRPVG